jgi:polysaccharide export outer membrane protein
MGASREQRPASPRVMRELSAFPIITIDEPRNGAIVTRDDPAVSVTFSDPRNELDLSTFRGLINGVDRTAEFQLFQSGATWRPTPRRPGERTVRDAATERQNLLERQGLVQRSETERQGALSALMQGQNTVVVSIKNLSGNLATASAAFVLDTSTLLATRAAPRSPLERAFLQPPTPPPSQSVQRAAPTGPRISRDLTQFGYDMFVSLLPALTPAMNLPVSPDYTLGPGDGLILYVWNIPGESLYDSASLVVDRSGAVFVPRVGSVPLQGLTLPQAQEVIRSRVSRYYSGFELRLALGELRGVAVYVVGEVARPGTYTVSPFSTLLDALVAAGGPTKMGTLRAVRLVRNGKPMEEVDLYDFLLRGERSLGPTLQAGDTIFVPPIGHVAGITGEVKRPGIYELRPGTTLGTLLAMAGGPLPTGQLDRVQVERQGGVAGKRILDLAFLPGREGAPELLRDGDLVTIFPGQDRLRNAVTLEGFVRTPGEYEWRPGMRVSELLKPDMLLPEAYRERVEIVRMRADYAREILIVDLGRLWATGATPDPAQDLALQPLDIISVKSEVLGPETVTISGQVRRPGTYSIAKGERLSSLIERAGGFLPEAFPRGAVFTRESIRRVEQQQLDKFTREQEQTLLAESAATTTGALQSGGSDLINAAAAATAQRRELLRSLTALAAVGRLSVHMDDPDRLAGTPTDILLEDGDALFVPQQPTSVLVVGAVRNSTSLLYQKDQNAQFYIDQAGGTRREADIDQTYILKPDGTTVASFVKLRKVEVGDTVVVPLSTEAKYQTIPLIRDVATIVGQIFLPIGVIGGLLK